MQFIFKNGSDLYFLLILDFLSEDKFYIYGDSR